MLAFIGSRTIRQRRFYLYRIISDLHTFDVLHADFKTSIAGISGTLQTMSG